MKEHRRTATVVVAAVALAVCALFLWGCGMPGYGYGQEDAYYGGKSEEYN